VSIFRNFLKVHEPSRGPLSPNFGGIYPHFMELDESVLVRALFSAHSSTCVCVLDSNMAWNREFGVLRNI